MTSLQTQLIVVSMESITLLSHLQLGTHAKFELSLETRTTPHLPYICIILHANHCYSSAVPSISYDPAEHKPIFFKHGTASVGLILRIKIRISFEEQQKFMSARWDAFHE